jgi:hypothetical protein
MTGVLRDWREEIPTHPGRNSFVSCSFSNIFTRQASGTDSLTIRGKSAHSWEDKKTDEFVSHSAIGVHRYDKPGTVAVCPLTRA